MASAEASPHSPSSLQAAASSAAARTFAVPELLENILLQLHDDDDLDKSVEPSQIQWSTAIRDLFCLQRVDSTFKKTINGSITLRRAMLLDFDERGDGKLSGIDLLLNKNSPALDFHPALPYIKVEVDCVNVRGDQRRVIYLKSHAALYRGKLRTCRCFTHLPELAWARSKAFLEFPKKTSPHASWRKMKLSSRPELVQVEHDQRHENGPVQVEYDQRYENGECHQIAVTLHSLESTLGDAFDCLEQLTSMSHDEFNVAREKMHKDLRRWNDGLESLEQGDFKSELAQLLIATKRTHAEALQSRAGCGICPLCHTERVLLEKENMISKNDRENYISL